MSSPLQLTHDDLAALSQFFPNLSFARQEQIDALLHAATADFQAAPGSGKTTLLGAKLALMAARWPHERRGICILTHTNVAREEIERCLKSVPHGDSLLGYPHFIGTIQTFVNKFLAIPWLRTLGISLREIDEEDFADRFYRRAYPFCKAWVDVNAWERATTIRNVRYRGADLALVSDAETPLPATGKMIDSLRALKAAMARDGRLRHADMFAYAEQALAKVSGLAEAVEYRFPNVFIDEMQDTNDIQLGVLSLVFKAGTIVQRFGDVNQSILNRGRGAAPNSFPASGSLEVRTSLRFGRDVAAVANSVKAVGGEIDGQGPPCLAPPTLILYSAATAQQVIARFGNWIAGFLPNDEVEELPVKAICAIKTEGNRQQKVGRHITDYFPQFDDAATKTAPSQRSVRQLLRTAATHATNSATEKRSAAARTALLLMVQKFGVHGYRDAKTWRELALLGASNVEHISRLRGAARDIVLNPCDVSTDASCKTAILTLLVSLGDIIDGQVSAADLPVEWIEGAGPNVADRHGSPNTLLVETPNMKFPIHVATIASVKGETHLATLVLESCRRQRYDIKEVLPYLCGDKKAADVTDAMTEGQLMNIFVGASRPRKLLALAMHADRMNDQTRQKLEEVGWNVLDWTTVV